MRAFSAEETLVTALSACKSIMNGSASSLDHNVESTAIVQAQSKSPTELAGHDDDAFVPSPKRRRIDTEPRNDRSFSRSSPPVAAQAKVSPNAQSPPLQNNPFPRLCGALKPPSTRTRIESLPVLENLSLQILSTLAKLSHSDALNLVRNPQTPSGQEYATVRSLFEHTRRLYSTGTAFLSHQRLGLSQPQHMETIRRANLAIFMSSIFTGEIGLRDMDRNFLDVFVPEGGKLLKAQGSIYLELKTQAFITARRTGAAEPEVVMADLFPADIETGILAKRPGAKSLAPSEQDFMIRLSSRRDILLADIRNNTLHELHTRYRWEDFSREVSGYLARNHEGSEMRPVKDSNGERSPRFTPAPLPRGRMEGRFSIHASPQPVTPAELITPPALPASPTPVTQTPTAEMTSALDDFVAQAARAAEIAMQGPSDVAFQATKPKPTSKPPAPTPARKESPATPQTQTSFQHYNPAVALGHTTVSVSQEGEQINGQSEDVPHVSQTAPTQILYERARQAASAKMNSNSRKALTPSQRRPWTTEEENALMTGLDRVRGPHWSQILAMYGPGGTINESLKDRNQVQLKDKARNLKLFFLKSGIEVPYYLKHVTGDLKSRAPTQASKQEAREREREQGAEARAHFDGIQGIMALAGGDKFPFVPDQEIPDSMDFASPYQDEDDIDEEEDIVEMPNEKYLPMGQADLDVEAMIARAAAEVSQTLDTPGWNR